MRRLLEPVLVTALLLCEVGPVKAKRSRDHTFRRSTLKPVRVRRQPLARLSGTQPALAQAVRQFRVTSNLALFNMALNAYRPDPDVGWAMRVPRLLWELSIAVVADQAAYQMEATWFLLSAIMTLTTSLTDIFVWAPVFASETTFVVCNDRDMWRDSRTPQDCYTDYVRGHGRLLVVVQLILGGIVYLMTAVTAWNAYCTLQKEESVEQQLVVLQQQSWRTRDKDEG